MTPDPALKLDPAVEEILRDIAADPDARLLRAPRSKMLGALTRGELLEPAGTTGLTSAERELVRVHRAEVAYLLRVLCAKLLAERPDTGLFLMSARHPGNVMANEQWRQAARSTLAAAAQLNEPSGSEMLRQCLDSSVAFVLSAADVAIASLRLEPTPQARVYLALDRILHGEPWTGLRILEAVVNRGVSGRLASEVWESIALAKCEQRRLPDGLRGYDRAMELDQTRSTPTLNSLVIALQIGDERTVLERSSRIEEFTADEPQLAARLNQFRLQRTRGHWSPTTEASRLRIALEHRVGPSTRRILDAFA